MSNSVNAQQELHARETLAAVRNVAASTGTESGSDISQPGSDEEWHAHTRNVRLVLVDDNDEFRYLGRAAKLEKAMIVAAAKHGVEPEDIPGIHGLCVDAVQAAESHDR